MKRNAERVLAIVALAAKPGGFHSSHLPEWSPQGIAGVCKRLTKAGKLFRASMSHKHTRYYSTEAAKDAALTCRVVAKPTGSIRRRPGWGRDDPVHMPLDDAGRPLWTLTVAPRPVPALWTNTHQVW